MKGQRHIKTSVQGFKRMNISTSQVYIPDLSMVQREPVHIEFCTALRALGDTDDAQQKMARVRELAFEFIKSQRMMKIISHLLMENMKSCMGGGYQEALKYTESLHACVLQETLSWRDPYMRDREVITGTSGQMFEVVNDPDEAFLKMLTECEVEGKNPDIKTLLIDCLSGGTMQGLAKFEAIFDKVTRKPDGVLLTDEENDQAAKFSRELCEVVRRLHAHVYGRSHPRHPFCMMVCRVSPAGNGIKAPGVGIWELCAAIASCIPDDIFGMYSLVVFHFHSFLQFIDPNDEKEMAKVNRKLRPGPIDIVQDDGTYRKDQIIAAMEENLAKIHHVDRCHWLFTCAMSDFHAGLKCAMEHRWHENYKSSFTGDFLHDVVLQPSSSIETIQIIASMTSYIDVWDARGSRALATAISRVDALKAMKILVQQGADVTDCDKRDVMSLTKRCHQVGKTQLVKHIAAYIKCTDKLAILQMNARSMAPLNFDCTFFLANVKDGYLEPIDLDNTHHTVIAVRRPLEALEGYFEPELIMPIKPGRRDWLMRGLDDLRNPQWAGVWDYIESSEVPVEIMEDRVVAQKPKKRAPGRRQDVTYACPDAEIAAVPGGSQRERPEKIVEREKFDVKFTDADREAVYLKLHEEKISRLLREYRGCSIEKQEDIPKRMNLEKVEERAKLALGTHYTDEIACIVFAQEYFVPREATPEEKSRCLAIYNAFKGRDDKGKEELSDDSSSELDERRSVPLVELVNPFKKLVVTVPKKQKWTPSINLLSAKHEFLFLRGLWTWRSELDKPEKVHEWIFEDCTRLGATRFYSALYEYSREKIDDKQSVSADDHDAGHIRHVLVHNFPTIAEIETEVEKILFTLGERVARMCHRESVGVAIVNLKSSKFASLPVRCLSPVSDATWCRDSIFNRISHIQTYMKLLESKQMLSQLNVLIADWEKITPALRIWVHPTRAIESCVLQIGELSKGANRFLSLNLSKYVSLCKMIRGAGYHENVDQAEWNYDPLSPELLASLIEGSRKLVV